MTAAPLAAIRRTIIIGIGATLYWPRKPIHQTMKWVICTRENTSRTKNKIGKIDDGDGRYVGCVIPGPVSLSEGAV